MERMGLSRILCPGKTPDFTDETDDGSKISEIRGIRGLYGCRVKMNSRRAEVIIQKREGSVNEGGRVF
jgi:hypothetical protein